MKEEFVAIVLYVQCPDNILHLEITLPYGRWMDKLKSAEGLHFS